jgi:hypothetical protein
MPALRSVRLAWANKQSDDEHYPIDICLFQELAARLQVTIEACKPADILMPTMTL